MSKIRFNIRLQSTTDSLIRFTLLPKDNCSTTRENKQQQKQTKSRQSKQKLIENYLGMCVSVSVCKDSVDKDEKECSLKFNNVVT